ncbi:MAG: M28 family metallopeptidase [Bryobacterales bacterium]|nr:M28 family metallopeptidase [Bryobacterales bacterium]
MRALILLTVVPSLWAQADIRGFAPAEVAGQQSLEQRMKAIPDPVRAKTYMERMAAEPHHAGSPASKAVADYGAGLFKQWGLDMQIETFEVLLPYPTHRTLEMTAPTRLRLKLSEPAMKEDPDSTDKTQLPLYNSYAASGDVTAPLVYVNYGIPEDYAYLKKQGIDVKGKIVIARYGRSWRGTKAKVAQENGAAGCLIYSDPHDDGYYQGDVFPKGPYRPALSAQRGSIMDMPLYVGDPLTPGWASEPGAKRLPREQAASLMKIPVLPVSYAEAQPLLQRLEGAVAPEGWRGALPITYHIGPGPATVHLKTDYDWTSKPIYNVIATIPGKSLPDEWVIYGNHHDAWVNGAGDPISGAIGLLETARAFSELRKTGWQPRRTVKFILWDAEEFGLIGSTEWVEKHRDELQQKVVAYINSDSNTGGALGAGGVPTLNTFFRQVMRDNKDPQKDKDLLTLSAEGEKKQPFRLGPLGAGSDYVAFVHHAGIPSLNIGFNKPGGNGTYHSIYDSIAWFEKTMDPDFQYSKALAQVMGTTILRFSEAPLLPFEFTSLESSIREWAKDLAEKNKLDMSAVNQALDRLKSAAIEYEAAYAAALPKLSSAATSRLIAINKTLRQAEQSLIDPAGLANRPFYKHTLYAPGIYTGYSAKTLPGVREPADAGNNAAAEQATSAVVAAIERITTQVEIATQSLSAQ